MRYFPSQYSIFLLDENVIKELLKQHIFYNESYIYSVYIKKEEGV